MSIEDRLSEIERQIIQLTQLVGRAIKPSDTVVTTSVLHVKEGTHIWCASIKCPDKDPLIQTGIVPIEDNWRYTQSKAELMAAWAGLQTALHLPGSTEEIHFITDSTLQSYLRDRATVGYSSEDLLDRYQQLLNIYTEDKISKELITQSQEDRYLEDCYKVLRELKEKIEKEEEKCSQSAESESSPETNK